ncbi:hypothetical protein L9F63_015320 [Diploptera punctata]|uniref:C-type lectin domain-containing protein n=1 Tax=Diploptera punctata TaxID=6984 RepID=A0AAD8A5U6_DIPPU|nr:hypothetical protein L9F63_015320 [Diploptera punctata]
MFLTLFVLCVLCTLQIGALDCFSTKSTILKLSINNSQNATGHWNAKVQVGHRAGNKQGSPLDLKLEQAIISSERDDFVFITANFTVPPRSTLPNDYELVPGLGFYKLHTDLQSWHTARVICNKEGAHLAIINSYFEYSVMKMLFDRNPHITSEWTNPYAFVGVYDLPIPRTFVTIFGEPLNATGYSKWSPKEPNYDGNCVVVARDGLLHDTNCSEYFPFFCEQEL